VTYSADGTDYCADVQPVATGWISGQSDPNALMKLTGESGGATCSLIVVITIAYGYIWRSGNW